MKKILLFASVIAALSSCTTDEYIGDNLANGEGLSGAITFNSGSSAVTRAELQGAEAARLLNKNFVVEGIKTVSGTSGTPTVVEVFDNYNVNYAENTADKSSSNTANWEYVNQTILSGKTNVMEQSIKYWDFAASKYDFWAYSLGGGNAEVSSLDHEANLGTGAYTITGNKADLAKVYISDLVTAYNPAVTGQPYFGYEVNLSFRSLATKVRVGLYETIPGYSVKDVKFYPSATGTPAANVVLFASSDVFPSFPSGGTSTYTVTFPTTGETNVGKSDYNKAHVTFDASGTKVSTVEFGTLSYGARHKYETEGNYWLRINSAQPTWATEGTAGDYSIVIPNEDGAVLTLKVDYTLESTDGTKENITVHGATALVPAQYTQWKSNYAYTYLFKISDNTNGLTNTANTDKVGLYPITLDAVVVGAQDGTQETITTVATPSITTYSVTSDVTTNNEYTTSDDIYVTAATETGTLMSMTGKATLYKISAAATEAEVLEALTKYTSLTSGTYVGRNDKTLTPVADALDLTKTEIPLVDGNNITGLTAGTVALIDKAKLTTATYYAYVFDITPSGTTPTTEEKYEALIPASGDDVSNYYTRTGTGTTSDPYVYAQASGTADGTTTYYDKYTVVSGAAYAIKVIKIK